MKSPIRFKERRNKNEFIDSKSMLVWTVLRDRASLTCFSPNQTGGKNDDMKPCLHLGFSSQGRDHFAITEVILWTRRAVADKKFGITVKPRFTKTCLIWTPHEQFSLSLEKALPFPLNSTHLIRTPINANNRRLFLDQSTDSQRKSTSLMQTAVVVVAFIYFSID